jgi:hypothetical protein
MVTLCAWCGRTRDDAGAWLLVPQPRPGVTVTHGICPACRDKVRATIPRGVTP